MLKIVCTWAIMLLVSGLVAAQDFEGTITFDLKVDDESGQAAMMASMMPTGYKLTIKQNKILMKMEGGMAAAMLGDIVADGETGTSYMIRHSAKQAYKMSDQDVENATKPADESKPKIEKIGETIEILGYKCEGYKMKMNAGQGQEMDQIVWVTKDIKLKRPKNTIQGMDQFALEGIEGFPLKSETTLGPGMKMTMTASEIDEGSVEASLFEVPEGYEIKDMKDFNPLGGFGK